MDTLTPAPTCIHAVVRIATRRPLEFVDLTARLDRLVTESGITAGLLNVQTLHTTTAIVINEHEPLLLTDFQAVLEALAPAGRPYRHDDAAARTVNLVQEERPNGHAHCRSLLLPAHVCLNIAQGRLQLGTWQRVFLVELDGPRERGVSTLVMGEARR